MCPACLSTAVLIAGGATSTTSLGAVVISIWKKKGATLASALKPKHNDKNKEESKWRPAK